MRFTGTKRFSPVIYENDLPDKEDYFNLSPTQITDEFLLSGNYYIDENWWRKQKDRCEFGYEVKNAIEPGGDFMIDDKDAIWYPDGSCYIPLYDLLIKNGTIRISGRHYFYLNFWPIYGVKEGRMGKTLINPRFTALDYFFARRIEMMVEHERDCQELKARQLGYSEKGAGMVLGYNYTFIDHSLNIIVAGEQADADHTMESCDRGLTALSNTQFYKERERGGDSKILIKSKSGSEIRALTAKDKPQSLSRFSPFWVWYEEVGKGKKEWSMKVNRYVRPSIITLGKKTGWQHYIGTAGEMDEGVYDLETRHYEPNGHKILAFDNVFEQTYSEGKVGHFTGKQWFHKIDSDGNPLFRESIEDILADQAEMSAEERYKDQTQRPIFASQAFMTSTVGYFGEHILNLLHRRKSYLQNHREANIIRRGRLEWEDQRNPWKGCIFIDDEFGWIKVVEEPEKGKDGNTYQNLYKAGCDSYDQDEAKTSNSRGAMYIRKRFNHITETRFFEMYVAQIIERPSVEEGGAEVFYEHVAKTCIYYGCRVNIEYSNLRIFQWLMDHGFEDLLEYRPSIAFAGKILDSQISNRYGTDKTLKPYILAILKDRLNEDFISRMFFIEQIDAFLKYRYDPSGKKYNCDITIASAEAEVMCKEFEFSLVRERSEKTEKKGLKVYTRIGDMLVEKYI